MLLPRKTEESKKSEHFRLYNKNVTYQYQQYIFVNKQMPSLRHKASCQEFWLDNLPIFALLGSFLASNHTYHNA